MEADFSGDDEEQLSFDPEEVELENEEENKTLEFDTEYEVKLDRTKPKSDLHKRLILQLG